MLLNPNVMKVEANCLSAQAMMVLSTCITKNWQHLSELSGKKGQYLKNLGTCDFIHLLKKNWF